MITLNLPLHITLPRKTKADKVIAMNMNVFRNLNYFDSNTSKRVWKEVVRKALYEAENTVYAPRPPLMFTYTLYPGSARALDVMNTCAAIDKFTADALQELGCIANDNYKILPRVHAHFGAIDKSNPRCELRIEELGA